MSDTLRITLGGVHENINAPWHMAIDSGLLDDLNVDLRWVVCDGGTGQMTARLGSGQLDLALVLTEGVTAYIARGGDARIIGTYVCTPLIWGIHVHAASELTEAEQLRARRYGISRPGSGSHLMAFVDAAERGWPVKDRPRPVKIGNLDGAIEAFDEGQIDAFLWEKYTTKPLVDEGRWRRIAETSAPWPAFVIAARGDFARAHAERLTAVIERVQGVCMKLQHDAELTAREVAQRYGLRRPDILAWHRQTRWGCVPRISRSALMAAGHALVEVDVLDEVPEPASLIAPEVCALSEGEDALCFQAPGSDDLDLGAFSETALA